MYRLSLENQKGVGNRCFIGFGELMNLFFFVAHDLILPRQVIFRDDC
jgi:hypothetical protein